MQPSTTSSGEQQVTNNLDRKERQVQDKSLIPKVFVVIFTPIQGRMQLISCIKFCMHESKDHRLSLMTLCMVRTQVNAVVLSVLYCRS